MRSSGLGLRESKARRRRRLRWMVIRWTLALVVILTAGAYSYETGRRLAEREVSRLDEETDALSARIEQLETENRRLEDAAAQAGALARRWQERYRADRPTGELKELYDLMRQRLGEGVESARLAFLLRQAEDRKTCAEGLETKRFYVRTPLYDGANDTVGFADSAIIVTARGEASVDPEGQARARYDPARPVVVRFARLGGEASEISGVLPLHHSLVVGDREYRFAIVAGEPGMVRVTAGHCPFP